ncbi:helix-turn-helix domain-containing protein [Microbulbifer harenosus]|uniref:helix-turn-helix domain-containing protein n=1 Tax=Microbulbifer harenosus TaxID=2576840 RepID=UPI001FE444EA|nr:helix-turn-helix transcriptional regulator [Microbulbifer harenosus]
MSYLNDQILKSLREARQRKGLSQRELSAKSGVPQSHISKIEKGGVDLRVSSLIALARVLDLELELVPKKSVPAVKSIVRSSVSADYEQIQKRIHMQLAALDEVAAKAAKQRSTSGLSKELESIQRISRQIERLQPRAKTLEKIENSTKVLQEALAENSGVDEALRRSEEQLRSIRNLAVHIPIPSVPTKPAYSLDESDDDE